jgi:hypothetical protein
MVAGTKGGISVPDIIEVIEVPPYNEECTHCLRTQLKITALNKAAQTLAGTDYKIQETICTVSHEVQENGKRIKSLEDALQAAEIAAKVSKIWWAAMSFLMVLLGGIVVWWVNQVQTHLQNFPK